MHPEGDPTPVLLILADISGYTRYMTANVKTLAHSQTIITELVETIIRQVELPLEVAKLEGDAVFLFCRKQGGPRPWDETRAMIAEKMLAFFQSFQARITELTQSTTCSCTACTHIEKLRLKVIVHSGEALFHRVLNFQELAGVDVIIAHRLLKNSVSSDQYLLVTEPALRDLQFPSQIAFVQSRERYEEIGHIKTFVFLPEQTSDVPATPNLAGRFGRSWDFYQKILLGSIKPLLGHPRNFAHLTPTRSRAADISFALVMLLLSPLFFPAGVIVSFFHALRPAHGSEKLHDAHEHNPDGSCCAKEPSSK